MRKLGKIKINIKEPTPTAAERLHQSQQAIRKAKGLPDPSHYKQMAAQKKAEIDSMKEEKQTELKPRNFVAKNAKTVGAGKHKDVKKAIKDVRGQKHKGKMEEEVEQLDEMPESSMKTRDVHAHLKSKGWAVARTSGGHDIYKHPKAKNVIAVPRHKQLKAPLIKGILKSSQVSEEVVDEQIIKQGRFQSGPVKKPFKSITTVTSMKEAIKIGGIGSGKSSRRSYGPSSHGMDSAEGDTLENVPFHPKTEKDKRLKAALTDFGEKMKAKYPNLAKEDINSPITIVKKGTNIKQKISPNSYETFKHHGFRKEESEIIDEDKSDYQRKIEKNNKRFVAAVKRQQNPLSNVPIAKEIEKRMQQKTVKESAEEPTEGEMKGKQQGMSRRAQIVKNAAKGKKSDSSDTFQKDPELSSEIHKT